MIGELNLRQFFGRERLQKIAAASQSQSLSDSVDQIMQTVHTWRAGQPMTDDLSLLALEWTGAPTH